jgi:predicted polyphosphate/ATP-dependent NAD kinase
VTKRIGVTKTLLGVDAVLDGEVIATDATEKALLELLSKHDQAKIFVTPIGAQGFILGRGNQQISAKVVRKVGLENLVVLAAPTKLGRPGSGRTREMGAPVAEGFRNVGRLQVVNDGQSRVS